MLLIQLRKISSTAPIYLSREEPNLSSSWVCAIRSSTDLRRYSRALTLYTRMLRSGQPPDAFCISAALKAAAVAASLPAAVAIHSHIYKFGHSADVYTLTALINLYSKLDGIATAQKVFHEMPRRNVVSWNSILRAHSRVLDVIGARKVFDEMPVRDVVSWNTMLSSYAKAGDMAGAYNFFRDMPVRNPESWNGLVCAYIDRGYIQHARKLFDEMPDKNNVSWVAMISGYSVFGDVASSEELFEMMETKDVFSWNAMIACYAKNGFSKDAIRLFNAMIQPESNVYPDEKTFSSVISACSQLHDLKYGIWIESFTNSIGVELDDHLRTAFIDLYSKCGAMNLASKHYRHLRKRDVVSYSAMILGCGLNGMCAEALCLFDEMVKSNISPNSATFVGVLTAYNHAGMVDEAHICFSSMESKYLVSPSADHYAIMVDLLGKIGRLEEAHGLIVGMPMEPHAGVWGALLLACSLHGKVELGELAATNCFRLVPDSSGYYVILANIYAEAGQWEKAKRLRKVMVKKRLVKVPGCSWVDPKSDLFM